MAECFCGCGRKVGAFAFGTKSANKMGRVIQAEQERTEQHVMPRVRAKAEAGGDAFTKRLDQSVADGEKWKNYCQAVIHGEIDFKKVPWPEVRAWVRDSRGMNALFAASPEQQQRIMRS